jgi:hypothetical protein
MRLISQDRKIDIPYENSVVYVHSVYGYNREEHRIITPMGDDTRILGKYSTEEKALKVMEMLQQQYMRHLTIVLSDVKAETTYFKFPPDESVNEVSA